jgi:hypothetical protein
MWRGTVRAEPLSTGSSFVGLGTGGTRMVIYPISHPDAEGRALINWIAEVTVDSSGGWTGERWFEPAKVTDFVHHFDAFRYPWLDVPAFLSAQRRGLDEPDDRPRPGAHMGRRARGADGRRGACDVSHRVERREPGDHRRAHHRGDDAGAWGGARGAFGL